MTIALRSIHIGTLSMNYSHMCYIWLQVACYWNLFPLSLVWSCLLFIDRILSLVQIYIKLLVPHSLVAKFACCHICLLPHLLVVRLLVVHLLVARLLVARLSVHALLVACS